MEVIGSSSRGTSVRGGPDPEHRRQASEGDVMATAFRASGNGREVGTLGRGAEPSPPLRNCWPYPQVGAPTRPGPWRQKHTPVLGLQADWRWERPSSGF